MSSNSNTNMPTNNTTVQVRVNVLPPDVLEGSIEFGCRSNNQVSVNTFLLGKNGVQAGNQISFFCSEQVFFNVYWNSGDSFTKCQSIPDIKSLSCLSGYPSYFAVASSSCYYRYGFCNETLEFNTCQLALTFEVSGNKPPSTGSLYRLCKENLCNRTPTPTSPLTGTGSATKTASKTDQITDSQSGTMSLPKTDSASSTWIPTRTTTSTVTKTVTSTLSPIPTFTRTPIPTLSSTLSSTLSTTPTSSGPSLTPTLTVTDKSTLSLTFTPTQTPSQTGPSTSSESPTSTPTHSSKPTNSPTPTSTFMISSSSTGTLTSKDTSTLTNSCTKSDILTNSGTSTSTLVHSLTSTVTPSPTLSTTTTSSLTQTSTLTWMVTKTLTATGSSTQTGTPPRTVSPTTTTTPTPSRTSSGTGTGTLTFISTTTHTCTPSSTSTNTLTTPTCSLTASNTPTRTRTTTVSPTPSLSPTTTLTSTFTRTPTLSFTPSLTNTRSQTSTSIPTTTLTSTSTGTGTPSSTPSSTETISGTPTFTFTLSPTFSLTISVSPTKTATSTSSHSSTSTPSVIPTSTATQTLSSTSTETITPTGSPTSTRTKTLSPTTTLTPTSTCTRTSSSTPSSTGTISSTRTATVTPSPTFSLTISVSPTKTPTSTSSHSSTSTPSVIPTHTPTKSFSLTPTPTNTRSFTFTISSTRTATVTPSPTFSSTISCSPTKTSTFTSTYSLTGTPSVIPTSTATQTLSSTTTETSKLTLTHTPSLTLSRTTATYTISLTTTGTKTPTQSPTPTSTSTSTSTSIVSSTQTLTKILTPTSSQSCTTSPTPFPTGTISTTLTETLTISITPNQIYTYSLTPSPTNTKTDKRSLSYTPTFTPTSTPTNSDTNSVTSSPSLTTTFSPTSTFTPSPMKWCPVSMELRGISFDSLLVSLPMHLKLQCLGSKDQPGFSYNSSEISKKNQRPPTYWACWGNIAPYVNGQPASIISCDFLQCMGAFSLNIQGLRLDLSVIRQPHDNKANSFTDVLVSINSLSVPVFPGQMHIDQISIKVKEGISMGGMTSDLVVFPVFIKSALPCKVLDAYIACDFFSFSCPSGQTRTIVAQIYDISQEFLIACDTLRQELEMMGNLFLERSLPAGNPGVTLRLSAKFSDVCDRQNLSKCYVTTPPDNQTITSSRTDTSTPISSFSQTVSLRNAHTPTKTPTPPYSDNTVSTSPIGISTPTSTSSDNMSQCLSLIELEGIGFSLPHDTRPVLLKLKCLSSGNSADFDYEINQTRLNQTFLANQKLPTKWVCQGNIVFYINTQHVFSLSCQPLYCVRTHVLERDGLKFYFRIIRKDNAPTNGVLAYIRNISVSAQIFSQDQAYIAVGQAGVARSDLSVMVPIESKTCGGSGMKSIFITCHFAFSLPFDEERTLFLQIGDFNQSIQIAYDEKGEQLQTAKQGWVQFDIEPMDVCTRPIPPYCSISNPKQCFINTNSSDLLSYYIAAACNAISVNGRVLSLLTDQQIQVVSSLNESILTCSGSEDALCIFIASMRTQTIHLCSQNAMVLLKNNSTDIQVCEQENTKHEKFMPAQAKEMLIRVYYFQRGHVIRGAGNITDKNLTIIDHQICLQAHIQLYHTQHSPYFNITLCGKEQQNFTLQDLFFSVSQNGIFMIQVAESESTIPWAWIAGGGAAVLGVLALVAGFGLWHLKTKNNKVRDANFGNIYQLAEVYHVQIQFTNPVLQDSQLLQIANQFAGMEGVNGLIEIGSDPNQYSLFQGLEQSLGTEKAVEAILRPRDLHRDLQRNWQKDQQEQIQVDKQYLDQTPYAYLFWTGMMMYRLPATYDQVQYLLKTTGLFDLQACYEANGLEAWVSGVGQILRPSLFLGGATLAYYTSSNPLILLAATSQPEFGVNNNTFLSSLIYYFTSIVFLASAYSYSSPYTLPIMAVQGMHLLGHVLVDTKYVAQDNQWMQFFQSSTAFTTEALGVMAYPYSSLKILQGISLFAQGIHSVELACEGIAPYLSISDTAVDEPWGSDLYDHTKVDEY